MILVFLSGCSTASVSRPRATLREDLLNEYSQTVAGAKASRAFSGVNFAVPALIYTGGGIYLLHGATTSPSFFSGLGYVLGTMALTGGALLGVASVAAFLQQSTLEHGHQKTLDLLARSNLPDEEYTDLIWRRVSQIYADDLLWRIVDVCLLASVTIPQFALLPAAFLSGPERLPVQIATGSVLIAIAVGRILVPDASIGTLRRVNGYLKDAGLGSMSAAPFVTPDGGGLGVGLAWALP